MLGLEQNEEIAFYINYVAEREIAHCVVGGFYRDKIKWFKIEGIGSPWDVDENLRITDAKTLNYEEYGELVKKLAIKVAGRLRNWIHRLLLGSLLCSIPLMSMPVLAQNSEQNPSPIESGGQSWEEEDPIPIGLASLCVSLAAEIAERSAEERDVEEMEDTLKFLLKKAIGGVYTDLTDKLTNLDKKLAEDIHLLEMEYAERMDDVEQHYVNYGQEITDLWAKIEGLKSLKKIVLDLKNAIDSETKLWKDAVITQTQRIDDLERSIHDLTKKTEESGNTGS